VNHKEESVPEAKEPAESIETVSPPTETPSTSHEEVAKATTPRETPHSTTEPELQPVSTPKPTPEPTPEPKVQSTEEPTPATESAQEPISEPQPQPDESQSQTQPEPEIETEPVPVPQAKKEPEPSQPKKETAASPEKPTELPKAATSISPERSLSLTSLRGKNHAVALNHYEPKDPQGLSFRKGDIITVLSKSDDGKTLRGELKGKQGTFPASLVQSASALVSSKPAPTSTIERAVVAKDDMSGVAQRTASLRDQWKKVVSQGALEAPSPSAPKPKPAPVPSVSGARTLFKGLEAKSATGKAIPRRNFGAKPVPSKPERASRMFTESDVKALQASGIRPPSPAPTSTPAPAPVPAPAPTPTPEVAAKASPPKEETTTTDAAPAAPNTTTDTPNDTTTTAEASQS